MIASISAKDLFEQLKSNPSLLLVDVREPWEHDVFNIGGELIPLGSLMESLDKFDPGKTIVLYCQKGIRSQVAIQRLQQKATFPNLLNLTGGMDAWQKAGLSSK